MRRPPYHRDDRDRLDVKMTPMIDVIFLLLIFFVCTASFQSEGILPTNLSGSGAAAEAEPIDPELEDLDEIVVGVLWDAGAQGRPRPWWEINGRRYRYLSRRDVDPQGAEKASVESQLRAVAGLQADLPVILDVEDAVPIENVIDVCDLCRQIGLERVLFSASAEP